MSARIIDGKAVAAALRARLAQQVATLPFRPGLAVVLVGDDPASAIYVRAKDRAASAVGIAAHTIRLPADTSEEALITQIARLNADPAVDGILVQLPLPAHIVSQAAIEAIDPDKDVDGFHPLNVGRLVTGYPGLVPCTPAGVMKLLAETNIPLEGARALVLGRSVIVGRPMAALLLAAHATVTVAHSRTRDLAAECRRADIIVAAVGQAGTRARRLDRTGRHGDRRRREPARRRQAGGRRGLRRGCRGCRCDHPRAGWSRSDDHRLPAGEHGHRGTASTGRTLEVAAAPVDLPVAVARRLRDLPARQFPSASALARTLRVFLLGCWFSIALLAHGTEIGRRRRVDNGS